MLIICLKLKSVFDLDEQKLLHQLVNYLIVYCFQVNSIFGMFLYMLQANDHQLFLENYQLFWKDVGPQTFSNNILPEQYIFFPKHLLRDELPNEKLLAVFHELEMIK